MVRACFENPDEVLNIEYLGKRGKLLIVSVWCKKDREFEGSRTQERGQAWRPQPKTTFGIRGEWPQEGNGLARRQENPQGEGGQGMEPKKGAREGLVREGERREAARRG